MDTKIKKKSILQMATMDDPHIVAAVENRFRFSTEDQALIAMERIAKNYTLSKDRKPAEAGKSPVHKLWIRGYSITDAEKKKGHRGNFAEISIKPIEGKYFSLFAKKIEVDLKLHPQKERPKERHPNWAHPIMRAVEKGKLYPNIAEARLQLDLLHKEFPEVTIPGRDELHVMLYKRKETEGAPIQKAIIKIQPEGKGAKLIFKEKKKKPLPPKQQEQPKPNLMGKFTALVNKQRKKKKPVS